MNLSAFGQNEIKHLATGTVKTLGSCWENQTCVVIFFRRWGCMLCRLYAKQLSEIIPILKKNDIDIIGVGCEELGGKEFLDGNFFAGELYVDNNKTIYKAMEFKRFNYISIVASLLWSDSRKAIADARRLQIPGNFAGDGLQTGGALIVAKGGKLLFEFKQNGPADHIPNIKLLEVLGLEKEMPTIPTINTEQPKPECTDECTR